MLAVGFQALGLMDRFDTGFLGWVSSFGLGGNPVVMSAWIGWGIAIVIGFALPLVILETPAHWRRMVLWASTLVLVVGVMPILALAARWWTQSPAIVAVLWSGLCATIYAARHRMPCEGGNAGLRKAAQPK